MKILNINSYYYSSTVHRNLQKAMHDNGIESISYVPLYKGYIPRDECNYGIEDHVQKSECYNKLYRYIFHLKHNKILIDIKQSINFNDYDCLHAHSLFSNGYIAMKIKEKFNLPYIVAVRDTDLNTFFKYMIHLRHLGLSILKCADKIVFMSESYKNLLIYRYVPRSLREDVEKKAIIIPNGIDSFWLNNKGNIKHMQNSNIIKLLYVGAINRRKNVTTTLKAIRILRDKGYDIKFTVVGKALDQSIYNKIKDLPYVKYIPPVSKEKLIKIYRSNDIFVMPSKTETFGLVYAEAMSQGLPIIYTRNQGFDGQFDEGKVGYSVDWFNAVEISNKIVDIMCRYRELSKNCIELCDKFDWNRIVSSYLEVYKEIC